MERGKSREEWQKLCDARIADAGSLLEGRRYDAACYLTGYAVECALKARVPAGPGPASFRQQTSGLGLAISTCIAGIRILKE